MEFIIFVLDYLKKHHRIKYYENVKKTKLELYENVRANKSIDFYKTAPRKCNCDNNAYCECCIGLSIGEINIGEGSVNSFC